ncbi:MAG: hypothetical protein O2849_06570 [Proteobacteria bacterium]|nr:hypothetical protein [Pseudomonadota bacterium]
MIYIEDLPYLREIDIDFQNHIGGYMGGGSWAITSTKDSNGDNARIIIRKNGGYKPYCNMLTFDVIQPNLQVLNLQWIFFRGIKRFPDKWRRNNEFGFNSVISAQFLQHTRKPIKQYNWDQIIISTRLSPYFFEIKKTNEGGWGDWEKISFTHQKRHEDVFKETPYWNRPSSYHKNLNQLLVNKDKHFGRD